MQKWAEQFYKSNTWKICREQYIKQVGGLCEECLKQGLYEPATMVHHKVHLTAANIVDPKVALNFDNLEALCRDCHAKKHTTPKRYKIDEYGRVMIRDIGNSSGI